MKRANGEGSVYKRSDGRWVGSIHVKTADGSWERKYLYGTSRGLVEKKLAELHKKLDQGAQIAPAHLTVAAYLDEWATQTAARRVRPSTLTSYKHSITRYIVPAIGKKKLDKLTAREVRVFLGNLEEEGIGARTIQLTHATLRAALEDATREELLSRNVAKLVQAPRPSGNQRKPLTVDEARQLLASTRGNRLHALFVVLVVLGVRRSEALGLRWSDVDLDARAITIQQGLHRTAEGLVTMQPKTRRSRRSIPLPQLVADALTKHREDQDKERSSCTDWQETGFVFTSSIGTPIDPRNATRIFQNQCKAAGVPVVPLHALRHTCVSLLMQMGAPPRVVMEIAGHSALEMTMNVYGHVDLASRRDALDKLADLFE